MGIFQKVPKKYLVGNNWVNGFKTHNELTMYPLGKYPLAPSVHSSPMSLTNTDLQRIKTVLKDTFASATKSTYRSGLYLFHLFCDYTEVEECHRSPVNLTVLAIFISTLVGTYGGSHWGQGHLESVITS
jgi:hypothetical protein